MKNTSVVLRDSRDKLGTRLLEATLTADGVLKIDGHDYGDGVEQIFGPENPEYEWQWAIQSGDVAKLRGALGSGGDILDALAGQFSNDKAAELKPFLDAQGIQYKTWSRIGS